MLFHRSDKKDTRVVETPPYAMDYPSDIEKAPDILAGVYMLIDSSDEVVYVGKTSGTTLKEEIRGKIGADEAIGASKFRWFKAKSPDAAEGLEADWIERYHPRNNHVEA